MAFKAAHWIYFNTVNMGNSTFGNKHAGKNGKHIEYWIPGTISWRSFITTQRPKKQMGTKFLILRLLDILGISWGSYSVLKVINNTKEAILFILVVTYLIVRIYYLFRFNENRDRRERFEQAQREKLNGHHKSL